MDTISTSVPWSRQITSQELVSFLSLFHSFFRKVFLLGSHQICHYIVLFTVTFHFIEMHSEDLLLKHAFGQEDLLHTCIQKQYYIKIYICAGKQPRITILIQQTYLYNKHEI